MNRFLVWLASTVLIMSCVSACGPVKMPGDETEAQKTKELDQQVRANMRTAQLAAEHYAADHGSVNYPVAIDDMFKTYFPGGQDGRRPAQVGVVNPFTGINEFPVLGPARAKSAEDIRKMPRFELQRGKIEYIPLDGGRGYAIIGGAHDDKVLVDELNPEQNLVFSNN